MYGDGNTLTRCLNEVRRQVNGGTLRTYIHIWQLRPPIEVISAHVYRLRSIHIGCFGIFVDFQEKVWASNCLWSVFLDTLPKILMRLT